MFNIGQRVGSILPFDPTPGFQLTRGKGTGLPFVDFDRNNPTPRPTQQDDGQGQVLRVSRDIRNESGGFTQEPGGAGGGSGMTAAERAQALFEIENGLGQYNNALGSLDQTRDTGLGNIDRDYRYQLDRLTGQQRYAENDYRQGITDQTNQYQAKREQNEQGAANWLMGARRRAGANGAGGGSAARYALPFAAQTEATQANAADQTVATANLGALERNWDRTEDEFQNAQTDLLDQRTRGERDYRSQIEQQRAELLGNMGQLQGQRSIVNGGDVNAAMAAASPYTSRIPGLLQTIRGLSATPQMQARQVTVGRPDLSGYNWTRPQTPAAPIQDPTQGGGVRPVNALFGLAPEEQQLV